MNKALKTFMSDLLSTLVFLALFALTGNALLTTAVSIGVGIAQIAIEKWRGRPVEAMQWLSMGLVLVFGGAALLTHDSRFIMVKPTLIHFAVGAVMLKPGWLDRYLPEIAHANVPRKVIVASGFVWAAMMFLMGIANLAVAMTCTVATWALFNSAVPLALNFAGFGLQYAVFRIIVVRKRRAAAPAPAA